MKILFIMSHKPDPRLKKRIAVARQICETKVIAWDRSVFDEKEKFIDGDYIIISSNRQFLFKNIFDRVIQTILFMIKAIKEMLKEKPDCVFAANIDMLAIVYLYSFIKKTEILYEVADLNSIIIDKPKNIKGKILNKIVTISEKIMCNKIYKLILTSENFFELYYSSFIDINKVVFIPNIPNVNFFKNYKKQKNAKFTVGYLGLISYIDQLKMLIDVAEKLEINILIAGKSANPKEERLLLEYCMNKNYIEYFGSYDYEREISHLYSKCDCIYSVYNANLNNVKIALPNKLYEAIYCELPIIVAKGTYLEEQVLKMNVGVSVSHTDSFELEEILKKLIDDKKYYQSIVISCINHKNIFNSDFYNERLKKILLECISN